MSPSITAVIIDRDAASRKNVEALLKSVDQVVVAGTAEDYTAGYDMVVRKRPVIVILDLDPDTEAAYALI